MQNTAKQNYSDSVAFNDTRPGNEVDLLSWHRAEKGCLKTEVGSSLVESYVLTSEIAQSCTWRLQLQTTDISNHTTLSLPKKHALHFIQ